ncbi:MAG: hypothetical protein AAF799_03470 [Myxococcota bacterium]
MNTNHLSRSALTIGLALLASSACANRSTEAGDPAKPSQPPAEVTAAPVAPEQELQDDVLQLARSLHGADMTEIVLDHRAEAALTLDTEGTVRLWPKLRSADVGTPLALPVQEPAWMSLARADDGGFVVGFIDTAGGVRVARVEVDEQTKGARMTELFELPATQPHFELYVIDGGTRVLTLARDHSITLLDRTGGVVSTIDQASFVPWQLRVSALPGQDPSIMAVLAGPTRVQPIELRDDRLAIVGDARTVVIDRGPNRNDMSLSPDGRTLAALRKPRTRDGRFSVEFIDLETDARTLLVGELDNKRLPRMHWVDDERLLVDSGTGRGFWLERSTAIEWEGSTDRKEIEDVTPVPLREVGLAASTRTLRSQSTVVSGLRAVPTPESLILDPLDEPNFVEIQCERMLPTTVALDEHGTRVAWGTSRGTVAVESVGSGEARVLPREIPSPRELAFLGDDRIFALGSDGGLSIVGLDDGQVISTNDTFRNGELVAADFRRDGFEGGRLAIIGDSSASEFQVVEVTHGGFGATTTIPSQQRGQWPELGSHTRDSQVILERLGLTEVRGRDVEALFELGDSRTFVASDRSAPVVHVAGTGEPLRFDLRGGFLRSVVPDPAGERVAVVQLVHRSDVFIEFSRADFLDRFAVSLYDSRSGEQVWSRGVTGFDDLDWSSDGKRLAIAAHDGGWVIDANSGDSLLARGHLGVQVVESPDPTPEED